MKKREKGHLRTPSHFKTQQQVTVETGEESPPGTT